MTAFGCSDPIFQVLRFAFSKDAQEVLTELIRCGQILTGLTHLLELPLLSSSEFLQQGSKQVASGSFLYSHPNITLPAKGKIYSINEAYETLYDESTRAYLALLKGGIFLSKKQETAGWKVAPDAGIKPTRLAHRASRGNGHYQ